MRYLTGLLVLPFLFVLDLVLIVSLVGLMLIADEGPYTWRFVRGLWEVN